MRVQYYNHGTIDQLMRRHEHREKAYIPSVEQSIILIHSFFSPFDHIYAFGILTVSHQYLKHIGNQSHGENSPGGAHAARCEMNSPKPSPLS